MAAASLQDQSTQTPIAGIAPGSGGSDRRFKVLDITMKRHRHQPDALIEVLHQAQAAFGYLELEGLTYVAKGLKLPLSKVYGVATFYHLFSLKPNGVHTCVVCSGTACHVKGASAVIAALEAELGIKVGETTADNQVSLVTARCLGACGLAPALVLDEVVSGRQSPDTALRQIRALSGE